MTEPGIFRSFRDAALVARFEILRAVRTWQALAVIVLYVVTNAGATRIFVRILQAVENSIATGLHVPVTQYPGAMLDKALHDDEFRQLIGGMIGDDRLVDTVLHWPILAIFHLWLGIALMPFLAASTSAECISVDLRSRALRFEVQRTGRLELVAGRFGGQALLTAVGSLLAIGSTFTIGMLFMVGNHPAELLGTLLYLSLRSWAFSLPFIGVGVACSQLTASPAWARVMAIVATSMSWVAYAIALWGQESDHLPWLAAAVLQILPQGWILELWKPGASWVGASVVFLALGLTCTGAGYLRFARRDL